MWSLVCGDAASVELGEEGLLALLGGPEDGEARIDGVGGLRKLGGGVDITEGVTGGGRAPGRGRRDGVGGTTGIAQERVDGAGLTLGDMIDREPEERLRWNVEVEVDDVFIIKSPGVAPGLGVSRNVNVDICRIGFVFLPAVPPNGPDNVAA